MNINRNNYEVFFIDYHDGNLAAEQVAELFLFLESNPDLKSEFDDFINVQLENFEETFPLRDALKRGEINSENFSWYMAASVEDDLTFEEQSMLDAFIKSNPQLSQDVALFRAAKLEAINSEIYPDKKSLKQPVLFVFNFNRTIKYAVAAMLFLSLIGGGYFIYIQSMIQSGTGIAEEPIEVPVDSEEVTLAVDTINQEEKFVLPEIQQSNQLPRVQLAETNKQPVDSRTNENINSELPDEELIIINNLVEVPIAENAIEHDIKTKPVTEEAPLAVNSQTPSQPDGDGIAASEKDYLSVWEAIRQGADNSMRKIAGKDDSEVLTSADPATLTRTNVIDVIGKGIEKVSNEKVKVKTRYDKSGSLSAFNFSVGKFKIERTKSD